MSLDDRIRSRLPIQPVPGLPELRLHRAGPRSGLGRLVAGVPGAGAPYWAHVWAGGLVLARYLLDRPDTIAGRDVLDLGCGSGLVAIAAARAGARSVEAIDVDPCAAAATRVNAVLNGVSMAVRCADLLPSEPPPADVVLVGDLFYEAGLALRVAGFLDRCIGAGMTVLVGDPGRAPLPSGSLEAVHQGRVRDFGGMEGAGTVYVFKGSRGGSGFSASPRSKT